MHKKIEKVDRRKWKKRALSWNVILPNKYYSLYPFSFSCNQTHPIWKRAKYSIPTNQLSSPSLDNIKECSPATKSVDRQEKGNSCNSITFQLQYISCIKAIYPVLRIPANVPHHTYTPHAALKSLTNEYSS